MSISGETVTNEELTIENLSSGDIFIIKEKKYLGDVFEIKLIWVLEKTIKFYLQTSDGSWIYCWMDIIDFNEKYQIIEKVPPFNDLSVGITKVICTFCMGRGLVRDSNVTSGEKLCPYCFGSGKM